MDLGRYLVITILRHFLSRVMRIKGKREERFEARPDWGGKDIRIYRLKSTKFIHILFLTF